MDKVASHLESRRIVAPPNLASHPSQLPRRSIRHTAAILLTLWMLGSAAVASSHYTEKQIDAFAARVGKTYWVKSAGGKLPLFRTSPAAGAVTFYAEEKQSFEILEMPVGANRNPYYRVKFASGKEGYIVPESFLEELNLTILTVDPYADEQRKAEAAAKEETARLDWIQAQPWAPPIKKAAIEKQPVPGLTTGEIKMVLGPPSRVLKIRGPSNVTEERWYYPDGKVLVFYNQLLSTVNKQEKKK